MNWKLARYKFGYFESHRYLVDFGRFGLALVGLILLVKAPNDPVDVVGGLLIWFSLQRWRF